MKKLIAFLVACSILMVPVTASAKTMRDTIQETYMAFTDTFPDVPTTHLNFAAVAMLVDDGTIQGYPDGTFKPDGQVNRAELMKMTVGMFFPQPAGDISAYQNCFPDVKTDWYAYYVCKGKELGWIEGYPDGTFKPGNSVNRVEAIKIMILAMVNEMVPVPTEAEKLLPSPADAAPNAWYSGYLRFSIFKELVDGQHVTGDAQTFYYKPGDPITRKEVAEMIYRTYIYMVERLEFVSLMSEYKCYASTNSMELDTESFDAWFASSPAILGYTGEDLNNLTLKYENDDIVTAFIVDATEYQCGDKTTVDMTKWEIFGRYAK